jgi:hypothetical protein
VGPIFETSGNRGCNVNRRSISAVLNKILPDQIHLLAAPKKRALRQEFLFQQNQMLKESASAATHAH